MYPLALPPWLPVDILTIMVEKYSGTLVEELKALPPFDEIALKRRPSTALSDVAVSVSSGCDREVNAQPSNINWHLADWTHLRRD
jgi:hypothetical protein